MRTVVLSSTAEGTLWVGLNREIVQLCCLWKRRIVSLWIKMRRWWLKYWGRYWRFDMMWYDDIRKRIERLVVVVVVQWGCRRTKLTVIKKSWLMHTHPSCDERDYDNIRIAFWTRLDSTLTHAYFRISLSLSLSLSLTYLLITSPTDLPGSVVVCRCVVYGMHCCTRFHFRLHKTKTLNWRINTVQ